jgi:acyl-CoA thioesterase I
MRPLAGCLVLAAAIALGPRPAAPQDDIARFDCEAPDSLVEVGPGLPHAAARIGRREPPTIVALGSSSTQGIGASRPESSYPSRLAAELRERFPGIAIRVINRGRGGQDAPEELVRLDRDVLALHPDLVIWQVGTNAVLRRDDPSTDEELIARGIARLKAAGSDVVLMDLQYAPRVLARPAYERMENLIADAAKSGGVGLFRRFEIMRAWHATGNAAGSRMIGPDGLHMTDFGYRCLAAQLAEALGRNWALLLGTAARRQAARVAGLAGARPAAAAREPPAP